MTPWSLASRERSLAGALVALVRHIDAGAGCERRRRFDSISDDASQSATDRRLDRRASATVPRADEAELEDTTDAAVGAAARLGPPSRELPARRLTSSSTTGTKSQDDALLKRFGQSGEGWLVADSMRSVEPNVAVEVREPHEEGSDGTNQA